MRTTLNVKDDIIEKVMLITGAKNRSQAVNEVLERYVREERIKNLLKLKGRFHLEEDWKEIREREIDET